MSSSDLERALGVLRDGPVPLLRNDAALAQKERLLPLVRAVVRETPRRLRRWRLMRFGAYGTAAMGSLAALGLWLTSSFGVWLEQPAMVAVTPFDGAALLFRDAEGRVSAFTEPRQLPTEGSLEAGAGARARFTTPLGVEVEVSARTAVGLSEVRPEHHASRLSLVDGTVRCRVPRLAAGESFSVVTPGAEVIVHGTVFTVRTTPKPHTPCVMVEEGRVEVRTASGSRWLGAGERSGCEPEAAEIPRVALTPQPELPRSSPPKVRAPSTPNTQVGVSALAEQNRLLAEALVAEQRGDPNTARVLFTRLLVRHPGSPLATEARAGLARVK